MTGEQAETIRVAIADDQELIRMGLRMVLDVQPDIEVVAEAADGLAAIALDLAGIDVILMDVRMPRLDGIAATERIVAAPDAPRILVLTTFDLDEYAFAAIRAGASGFLLKDARPDELLAAIRAVHSGDAALAPSVTRKLMERFAAAPADTAPPIAAPPGAAPSVAAPSGIPAPETPAPAASSGVWPTGAPEPPAASPSRGGTAEPLHNPADSAEAQRKGSASAPGAPAGAAPAGRAHARTTPATAALDALTPREREILEAIAEGLSNDELAARFFLSASTVKTHVGRLLQKLGARDRVHLVILAYESGLAG